MDASRGTDSRPINIWPVQEIPEERPEDGPVALLRSVLASVMLHQVKLALWTLACLVLAFAYIRTTPFTYTAAATILLEPRRQVAVSGRETASPPGLDLNRADSELQVIRSERLLALVFDSLDLANHPELMPRPPGLLRRALSDPLGLIGLRRAPTPSEAAGARSADEARQSAFGAFASRISARRVGQSYVIEIAYASSDADLVARVANAAAAAYLMQSVAFKAEAARSGAEFVQGRVDGLATQARAAEAAVRAGTIPQGPIPDADARIIGAALKPLSPSAPRSTLILVLGGALGLMTGLFAAAVAGMVDRRLRTPAAITQETGLACLATLPATGKGGGAPDRKAADELLAAEPDGAFAASVANLRTAIKLVCPPEPGTDHRIIAFAAWTPDAGSSLVCMSLARLTQRMGRHVTVVDADVHGHAGSEPEAPNSLMGVLASNTPVSAMSFFDLDGVALLPARGEDVAPGTYVDFGERKVGRLLELVRAKGDVLVDLPPVADSVDAAAIARHADAVVVVVAAGRSTIDDVKQALRALRGVGANIIGAVLVELPAGRPFWRRE